MKKYLLVAFLACITVECSREDTCKENEMPEINFYFIPYGIKAEITSNQTGTNVTNQFFSDVTVKVSTYKNYCSGKSNGPFEDMYNVISSGDLDKLSLGAMSYRMDNKLDFMLVKIEAKSSGEVKYLGDNKIYYDELESFDEGNYNLGIEVYLKYDTGTKKIVDGYVVYVH